MSELKRVNLLRDCIGDIELPEVSTLNYLNNQEPIIYLCGRSSSGKTTFLNALFNMKKDELFTSTNISTKTEFRFKYEIEEVIESSDSSIIQLPDNYQDRKSLFKSLNDKEDSYTITLNQEVLKNRTIVDIPGVFDFKRNDFFSNRMLDEADLIYFFTPCTAKINDSEHGLLKKISKSGIPIIVLFTMGDITEVDQGITRKTIPKYVEARLDSCFKDIDIAYYQIISSNDFYKNKETHGIDILQQHIVDNDFKYKEKAEQNRLKRTIQNYSRLIENKLEVLSKDSESFKSLVERENQLWYSTEIIKLNKEIETTKHKLNMDVNWLEKNCEEQIFSSLYKVVYSLQNTTPQEQFRKFELNWNQFWSSLNEQHDFLQPINTKLPPYSEGVFEQINVDFEKFKKALGDNKNEDQSKKNKKTSDNSVNHEKDKNQNTKTAQVNKAQNKQDSKKLTQSSDTNKNLWMNISWVDFLKSANEAGVNLENAKLLWKKWNYFKEIKSTISQIRENALMQIDHEFQIRTSKLESEMDNKIEKGRSEDPTIQLIEKLKKSLNLLNDI